MNSKFIDKTEEIEKVARTIAKYDGRDFDSLKEDGPILYRQYSAIARVAIKALMKGSTSLSAKLIVNAKLIAMWDDLPEWANFVATDKEGQICCYEQEPILLSDMWSHNAGTWSYGPFEVPVVSSHWTTSLIRRQPICSLCGTKL